MVSVDNRRFVGWQGSLRCLQYSRGCGHVAFQIIPSWSHPNHNHGPRVTPDGNAQVEWGSLTSPFAITGYILKQVAINVNIAIVDGNICNFKRSILTEQTMPKSMDEDVVVRSSIDREDSKKIFYGRRLSLYMLNNFPVMAQTPISSAGRPCAESQVV